MSRGTISGMDLLAHPFGIAPSGGCLTVQQGTDDQYSQLLTVAVGTRQGERDMALLYGLVDPAWRGLYVEDVQAVVDQFGPPIVVDDIETTVVDEVEQLSNVTWHAEADDD